MSTKETNRESMATPSPTASLPSDSNPNSTATPPQQTLPFRTPPPHDITVVALAASTSACARKTQPVLWTHDETLLLIDTYKEKWYAIGHGPLKAIHWEDISVTVSSRSGIDRSSTQCRHKIEKMRKRFRSERQIMGPTSLWPFYTQMEELESNPAPISAQPLTRLPPSNDFEEEEDDEEEDEDEDERQSKSRSINYILRRPSTVNRFARAEMEYGERWKRKRNGEEEEEGRSEKKRGASAVAAEIRAFADRVMAMEKKKMEFAKESVQLRKEMEMQRLDLIQSSQTRILHFLSNAFHSL